MMRAWPLLFLLAACGGPSTPPAWTWTLPPGFPEPAVPAENPMTEDKVELGRRLFFDVRLSQNGTQSCGSCHLQDRAFTDGKTVAVGSTGQHHRRNAQGLTNVAWAASLTWANPLVNTLERQALLPLLGETPVELGWAGREQELFARLGGDADYAARFARVFPGADISLETITRALAAFERTLISGGSAYDRWVAGDDGALSESAKRGLALFNSERFECYHCHAGFSFSDSVSHAGSALQERPFHNTGLYDLDGQGSYPAVDTGLEEITDRAGDMGRFRAPGLRNLSFTAPYMHDGSLPTLDAVLDAYAAGGLAQQTNGRPSPLRSDLVRGFTLSAEERADLKAFLLALDDPGFLSNPALSDPWTAAP